MDLVITNGEKKMGKFKFEKILSTVYIRDKAVVKYVEEAGEKVDLRAETVKGKILANKVFANQEEYKLWYDKVLGDRDFTYDSGAYDILLLEAVLGNLYDL